jgi:hypothetical protein
MQPVALSLHFQAKHTHTSKGPWKTVRVKKTELNYSLFESASMEINPWSAQQTENMIFANQIIVWIR